MPLKSRIAAAGTLFAAAFSIAAPAGATVHHKKVRHPARHPVHHRAPAHAAAASTGNCAAANATAGQASAPALRLAVVCLVNQQRTSRRLPALHIDGRLDRSAQGWTDRMVNGHTFAHVVNGSDPGTRVSAVGYNWWTVGENIATGFATPRDVVRAWMASTGHCENILSPQFANVGTGVVNAPVDGFASGLDAATWTQDFGTQFGTNAPSGNTGPASGCPYSV